MSTVAVVTSSPPFVEGGHLVIARALVTALRAAGHSADIVLTPQNRFGRQAAAYAATWLTDVGQTADGRVVDQVISLRFPSYAVRHPRHVCWLNHTMREYYDLWPAFRSQLSGLNQRKESIRRQLIHRADRYLLGRNVSKLFVQSETIRRRLMQWPEVHAEVMYPPPPQRPYRVDGYEPYLFAVSRFTRLKRMALIVDALAEPAAAGIHLVLAGEGEELSDIQARIRGAGLERRVQLTGRLSEADLVDHLARCRAVVFPPFDEDYGFVTVEAFASSRPVITCHDSGGPAEIVDDGVSGLVVDPTPAALAQAFRHVVDNRDEAARMGAAGASFAARLTWPAALSRLLLPVN